MLMGTTWSNKRLNTVTCIARVTLGLASVALRRSLFHESGRYIVEKLLERDDETEASVVAEILECEGDELVRLATSVYEHFVVEKALKVTRVDLFRGLVNKLKPFLPLLRTSPQSTTIAEILE
ncbi:hypothetical protein Bca52824_036235 [Brassica carinata]|uniref:PUM-HD domain-containing protein n=1 Tax=Brassica carinata TaxID=52824 RepID=A0A8X7S5M4_BRACI|nr:hypothetical protein Bca52824_036235 [Brassica carinata]